MSREQQTEQRINFTKMHGCGNDYIYIDCFEQKIDCPENLAVGLSRRHFSIGSDGLVLICPSDIADAKMRMFNADGSEGKMCGNAIRCVGKYLHDKKGLDKNTLTIETQSGIKTLTLFTENGKVTKAQVNMGKAELTPSKIPVDINADKAVNYKIQLDGKDYHITCVSMGNPHCVIFGDDPDKLDLCAIGPKFENYPLFPQRINTEFIQVLDRKTLKMRVWERGSGETLACGTGACAAAVAAVENNICPRNDDINVILKGGQLTVRYTDDGTVYMTGGADFAFEGTVDISEFTQ